MQIKWFKETDCVCIYKNEHVIEGRSYIDRANLDAHVLERGNVSLHLNNFSVSDVGDYYCQVISGDTTKQITVGREFILNQPSVLINNLLSEYKKLKPCFSA